MSLLLKKAISGLLLFFFIANPLVSFAEEPGFDSVPTEQASAAPSDQGNAFGAFAGSSAGCNLSLDLGDSLQKLFLVCLPMVGLFVSTKALFYSASLFDNLLYFSINSAYLRLPVISEMWSSIKDLANIPKAVSFLILNLKTSPVEICTRLYFSFNNVACVPFPAPGGPNNTMFFIFGFVVN